MDSLPDDIASSVEAQVRTYLASKDRIRAIGECRVRLNCDFDAAHAIVCLIERSPRTSQEIRDAMQKAVVGERIALPLLPANATQRNPAFREDDATAAKNGSPNQPTPPAQESQAFRQRFRVERVAFIATSAIIAGIFGGSSTDLGPLGLMLMVGFVMFCFYAGAKTLLDIGGFFETVAENDSIAAFDWKRFLLDPLYFLGVFVAVLIVTGISMFIKWAFTEGQ